MSPRALGEATQAIYVHVDDPDAHFDRARSAGADITGPPRSTDLEHRVRDLEGHLWTFATYVLNIELRS